MKKVLLFLFLMTFSIGLAQVAINQPTDYQICSPNDFAQFDLTTKTPEILGGQNPADFDVNYYLTQDDAFNMVNPIPSLYTNTSNPQQVFVSVFENSTGNIAVAAFDLVVNLLPLYTWSFNLNICDEGNPDGFGTFDLTQLEQEFMNGNQDIILSYFENYQDALAGVDAIPNPDSYTNTIPFNQEIYILAENVVTGCGYVNTAPGLILNVDSLNVANDPTPYLACDPDGDGFFTFNLNTKTSEILNGNPPTLFFVTYHESIMDAENGTNALPNMYTNIVALNQVIYARVSNNQGCFQVLNLELIVDIDCVSASSVEAFVCGESPNVPVDYDLTSQESSMLNGQNPSDFTFTYYMSETNALSENNPITSPESYSVSTTSEVYVRIENQSGSFTIVSIFLNFDLGPDIFLEDTYTICENGFVILTPSVTGSNGYSFSWNTGESDPEIFANAPGNYSVQVTDLNTGCVSEASTLVLQGDIPVINTPSDITICPPNNVFDLTTSIPEVLNGMNANDFIISFFRNINDAISNVQAIPNPSSYVSPFQAETIYVRVQNNNNDCFEIVEFDVIIELSCPVIFECAEGPINFSFCYESDNLTGYTYESLNGLPIQVNFNAGQVENNFDELVVLDSDGATNLNADAPYGNDGDLTGLSFTSTGSTLTVIVTSDGSISCVNQNYIPIDFDVSCIDPNAPPTCNATLISPENGANNVNETTDLTWTNASGFVLGYKLSVGLTSGGTEFLDNEDVGDVSTYDLGILDFETTYYVTITPYNDNGDAENCEEFSFTTRPNPNQTVVCEDGVVNTTYCYDNDDTSEFSFQSSDGLPLTIIFNAGSTETNFDEVYIVDSDGTILNPDLEYGNFGDFTGLSFTSTGDSLTVRFDSDFTISCSQGSDCCTAQFDFDVFCASSVGIIDVNAFIDDNANTVFDANEFNFANGFFTYEVNGDGMINTVNSSTGHFQIISTNDTDVYEITFNLYEESAECYDVTIPIVNGVSVIEGNTVTVDFPVVEEQSCEDLAVYLINYWTPPRPGFSHENFLVLENLGFTTITSGTVEYIVDPLLIYNSVTAVNPTYTITNTATGFTVDFVNLQSGDVEYIDISLTCPASVELGDIVTNTASYVTDTNDLVASNNVSTLSELVVGSWDPNDKMEAHGPRVLFDEFSASDEWLYYTIRFQNLGTFPATFVRIEDELDNQLDETTFQMLRSSHDYVVTRTESSLEWFFDEINLPAEQDDAEGSNGFVYFRIKPNAGYALGDIIPNTAAIFFDFNAPVITNRFETEFVDESLSISEFELNGFEMYPNPSANELNIKLHNSSNATISIIDVQGKRVMGHEMINQIHVKLNVSDLQSGLYFVRLSSNDKTMIKKLIKE